MAEASHPLRIRRGQLTQLGGEGLRSRSHTGHALGHIVVGEIIPDDNLHDRVGMLPLPVIARQGDGSLIVPTWRVSAAIATLGKESDDKELRWLASRLGVNPEAALVVPEERVSSYEPL